MWHNISDGLMRTERVACSPDHVRGTATARARRHFFLIKNNALGASADGSSFISSVIDLMIITIIECCKPPNPIDYVFTLEEFLVLSVDERTPAMSNPTPQSPHT